MDAEERRELVIEAIRTYLKEIGLSDNTQALFVMVAENILFPPVPPRMPMPLTMPHGIAGPFVSPVLAQPWSREDKPGDVRVYLNVANLYHSSVEITIGSKKAGSLQVLVEDNSGEEWTLNGATAQAFLVHATKCGMFDGDDNPPEEIAELLTERKRRIADFESAVAVNYGPSTHDMEKAFGAHPGPVGGTDPEETIG